MPEVAGGVVREVPVHRLEGPMPQHVHATPPVGRVGDEVGDAGASVLSMSHTSSASRRCRMAPAVGPAGACDSALIPRLDWRGTSCKPGPSSSALACATTAGIEQVVDDYVRPRRRRAIGLAVLLAEPMQVEPVDGTELTALPLRRSGVATGVRFHARGGV